MSLCFVSLSSPPSPLHLPLPYLFSSQACDGRCGDHSCITSLISMPYIPWVLSHSLSERFHTHVVVILIYKRSFEIYTYLLFVLPCCPCLIPLCAPPQIPRLLVHVLSPSCLRLPPVCELVSQFSVFSFHVYTYLVLITFCDIYYYFYLPSSPPSVVVLICPRPLSLLIINIRVIIYCFSVLYLILLTYVPTRLA